LGMFIASLVIGAVVVAVMLGILGVGIYVNDRALQEGNGGRASHPPRRLYWTDTSHIDEEWRAFQARPPRWPAGRR
jgi:hypothetical protein